MGNKIIYPVNVCIKRFYRGYVEVDENATDEEIRSALMEQIIEKQDNALCEDPDLEIEPQDIIDMTIDHDYIITEKEHQEFVELMKEIND